MTEIQKPRIAVLGGGSFGTVIAGLAASLPSIAASAGSPGT